MLEKTGLPAAKDYFVRYGSCGDVPWFTRSYLTGWKNVEIVLSDSTYLKR